MKIVIIQVSSLLQELQHPLFYQGVFQADQEDSSWVLSKSLTYSGLNLNVARWYLSAPSLVIGFWIGIMEEVNAQLLHHE